MSYPVTGSNTASPKQFLQALLLKVMNARRGMLLQTYIASLLCTANGRFEIIMKYRVCRRREVMWEAFSRL